MNSSSYQKTVDCSKTSEHEALECSTFYRETHKDYSGDLFL